MRCQRSRQTVDDATTAGPWSGTETTGASAYDTATVTGVAGFTPTGSVSYNFFANDSCSGDPLSTQGVILSGGTVPSSAASPALAAGTYGFQATYSGDANYTGTTGPCEAFSVGAGSTGLSTAVNDAATNEAWSGTETTGASAYDTATVTGVAGFTPTGSVSYNFFANDSCSGDPLSTQGVILSGGTVPSSAASPALAAGTYGFQATYSGDANYTGTTGPCEAFIVSQAAPALTVTKTVTSTGAYNAVGQVIDYKFVATNTGNVTLSAVGITDTQTAPAGALTSGPTCQARSAPTDTCSGSTTSLLPGQSAIFTASFTITQADLDHGSVSDSATASGTPTSVPSVTSPPSTVTVVMTQAPALAVAKSTTSTGPYNAVGQVIDYKFVATNTGNATLSAVGVDDAQTAPAGSLSSGPTCQARATPAGSCSGSTTTLLPGQSATFTASYTITQADLAHGTVSDSATASGAPPGCGRSICDVTSPASAVTVMLAAVQTIRTTVDDATTGSAWSGTEGTGATALDTATLLNQGSVVPTGGVTYSFFDGRTCSGTPVSTQAVRIGAGGEVPNSQLTARLAVGAHGFRATYSGDSNYTSATGPCAPFSVSPVNVLNVSPNSGRTLVARRSRSPGRLRPRRGREARAGPRRRPRFAHRDDGHRRLVRQDHRGDAEGSKAGTVECLCDRARQRPEPAASCRSIHLYMRTGPILRDVGAARDGFADLDLERVAAPQIHVSQPIWQSEAGIRAHPSNIGTHVDPSEEVMQTATECCI